MWIVYSADLSLMLVVYGNNYEDIDGNDDVNDRDIVKTVMMMTLQLN